ncbi:MAG TPA: TRAP transporter substrate-binding protein [Candidatus Methylomirabilis sp.]
MKRMVFLWASVLCGVLALAPLDARAGTTIRVAHVGAPISPQQQAGEIFAKLVQSKTNGGVEIKLFGGSTLGSEQQLQEGVKAGSLDGLIAGTWESFLKWAGVFQTPFIFRDYAHFEKVVTGPVGQELMAAVESELGVKPLFIVQHASFRRITNSVRPILKPEDMKGLKIRDPNVPAYSIVTKALGAVPVPMDFAELYMALSRKVVDGQHNPLSHIVGSKFFEVQKYLTLVPYGLPPHIVSMSRNAWGRLSPEQQKAVLEAGAETAKTYPSQGIAQEREYIDQMKAKGMVVAEPKDIDLAAFLKIFNEQCVPDLKKVYGEKWFNAILAVK